MEERTTEGKDRQQEGNDTAPLCTALLWVHKNRSYYILWAGNVQLLLLRLFWWDKKIAPHKYALLPDYSRFPSCVVERPLRWENMSSGCLFAECALLVPAADGTKASERKPRHGIIKVQLESRWKFDNTSCAKILFRYILCRFAVMPTHVHGSPAQNGGIHEVLTGVILRPRTLFRPLACYVLQPSKTTPKPMIANVGACRRLVSHRRVTAAGLVVTKPHVNTLNTGRRSSDRKPTAYRPAVHVVRKPPEGPPPTRLGPSFSWWSREDELVLGEDVCFEVFVSI